MIITTWTAFIFLRRVSRRPFPAGKYPDDAVVEPEIVTVLEHWLRKVEDEAAKIFRQKSENRTGLKSDSRSDVRAFPSVGQDVAAARSKPETWEKFEDRRPAKMRTMDFSSMSDIKLSCSSSQELLEDRMRIQFMRWSQTRVYHVTSDMRKDAMQERVDKVRNSVSRVMFQACSDTECSPSDTELHVSISTI
ncbi:spermatogenesis-associated protein 19, mitochondrial [Crotalus tigris]|uniref:spermatogenesis-associated protein 19, mitochondrial n=1 Tax=Crotalus tigris TaxID=88082 RepID=UPI00192F9217|nr:spermatogenesis-associated protein 19, mitochondrial [Crotalus tigris]